MNPEVLPDYDALSARGAAFIETLVCASPGLLLGAATGDTPRGTYRALAAKAEREPELFGRVRVFELDEWGSLAPDHPATCGSYLSRHLVGPLGVGPDRYFSFDGSARDPDAECLRVQTLLADQGPIDLCVLGLGQNGHLAFNEPADTLTEHAHVAELAPQSQAHRMLEGVEDKPAFGLTLGMGDILDARRILLLVSGSKKREPLDRLLSGDRSPSFPASMLADHPRVTLLCDRAAMGGDR